jgi:hypothetical protein
MTGRYGRGQHLVDSQVRQMLLEMAERLEALRPDEPITAIGRHALIQATTMDPPLARALRTKAPEITGEQVRRDYAARLREVVAGMESPLPTRAERVAELHEQAAADFAQGQSQRALNDHRDDAFRGAGAQPSQAFLDTDR